ncbi:MAG: hypothetical protein IH845_03240 [Nanoarchaeota archaeon]|nr:hypothetical protein [Nanoarchaeota archaeon]
MDKIYKIDAAIIVITVLSLFAVGGYVQPLVIAPLNELETTETEILFSIEKAEFLLIDDNIEFSSPQEYLMRDGLKIDLDPGKYYWKAVGITSSQIRTLTIKSVVNLELRLRENSSNEFSVVNVGNVVLDVEVYNGTSLVETVKLLIEGEVNGTGFVGRQSDE